MAKPVRFWIRVSVLATLLVACSNTLNSPTIEAQIKADIERQGRRLTLQAVRCPEDVKKQAGAYFRCVGEVAPDQTFTINVVQQDDVGTLQWDVPSSKVIINLVKLETDIQTELSGVAKQRVLVDCGAVYRLNQPGDAFECRVVGGVTIDAGRVETVLVKVDTEGNLDWQEIRLSQQPLPLSPGSTPSTQPKTTPAPSKPQKPSAATQPSVDSKAQPDSSALGGDD